MELAIAGLAGDEEAEGMKEKAIEREREQE